MISSSARAALVLLLIARTVSAQVEHPVHWSARGSARSVAAGDTARVTLRATIGEFFHLYSTTQGPGGPVRTTIDLLPGTPWQLRGALRVPPPDTIPDGNFGIMAEVYDDSVSVGLTLTVAAGGSAAPSFAIRYQACTTRYCLPARTDTITVRLALATGEASSITPPSIAADPVEAAAAIVPSAAAPATDVASFGGPGGIGAFLLLAASMGALALLTPCVFPMIPITVTSFLAKSDDRARNVARAGLYALGIVASFTGLGVVTALLFGAAGLAHFSAHPAVNVAIAALFTIFALSLLGVLRISLPSVWLSRASSARLGSGMVGTLLLGVLFTLAAFTCTAPFVGTLLVMSSQGSWGWPLVGMLVFSCVFAAPFFALALVPGLLRRRPLAGDWMPALEIVVGTIELAAAVKFASNADLVLGWNVLTRRVVVAIWLALIVGLVVALLRRRRTSSSDAALPPSPPAPRGRFRVVGGVAGIALIGVLVPGLFGRRLGELDAFLPPMPAATAANADDGREAPWMLNDYRGALLAASRTQRPILIDFTGYTCTNCRWMEANMFPRPEVRAALDRFVRVRLYTDGLGEPYQSQQAFEQRAFGTVALPYYVVVDAAGKRRATFLGMTRDSREFLGFLERGGRR